VSQPPYGSSWPQQPPQEPQPTQPLYPQPPQPTQPLYPQPPQPQYPNPTLPLPPYQAPPPPTGQWGGLPAGPPGGPPQGPPPGPPFPPGPPAPPGPPGPPWGQPSRRNTTVMVVIAIIAVLAIGGGLTGLILATNGKKKHETHQSSSPTSRPTNGTGTPDFPTGSSGLPTGGTDFPTGSSGLPTGGTDFPTDTGVPTDGGAQVDQVRIAVNAQTVLNGLGNDDPDAFCPLIDPADLKRLLKDKHLDKCSDIELTDSTDRDDYRDFEVTNPSAIKITGDTAVIPGSAVDPSDFGAVEMRKDADGTWKYRFYT
jgi:hypothetical protein